MIDELEISYHNRNQSYRKAELAMDIVCQVVTRLDFAFVLKKCVFQPVQCLTHLEFIVESITETFFFCQRIKSGSFQSWGSILSCMEFEARSFQRFAGKCILSLWLYSCKVIYIEGKGSIIGVLK